MNFNVDDPLADLLSDNSLDNDNFFENPVGGVAKKISKPTKTKSKLEDLFGIQEETEADVLNPSDSGPMKSRPAATSTSRIVKQKPPMLIETDDDDEDVDLGFDPKRPKSAAKKNILEDLLGTIEPKKNIFDDVLVTNDAAKRPATATTLVTKAPISRQSTDTTTENSNVHTQARPKTSTGRRSSAQSASMIPDPLGLFGRDKETNASMSGMSTPVSKKRGRTADWLGLGVDTADTVAIAAPEPDRPVTPRSLGLAKVAPVIKDAVEIIRLPDSDDAVLDKDTHSELHIQPPTTAQQSTVENILLVNSMSLESTNALAALKQQESHLIIATQIKNQERALFEMQRKQETLLQQQDLKFKTLMQQQLKRQQQMEEHIKLQQQRINTHIQLMMAQPALVAPALPPFSSVESDATQETAAEVDTFKVPQQEKDARIAKDDELLQLENDMKRNELEKLRLEELLANMKVNYEKEIEVIDSSYKKQLKVLEEHVVAVEERLRMDNKGQKEYYEEKVSNLLADKQNLQSENAEHVAALKQDHEDEVRQLRSGHEADIVIIKKEHQRTLEAVRQSKLLEFAAVQENGNYLDMLRHASNNLEVLSGGLQGLRDDMSLKLETLNKERERKLDARERSLEDSEKRLKLHEETAEEEKRRLMELVSTLENQLNRLSKDSAEENWQLRQRMASLEAYKKAFEKEKEFHREQIERDEKRIEDLKNDLQEERTRIVVERSQIEMERKLHVQDDLSKERLELEAQIRVAQDTIRRADEERHRCHKLQRELENRKRLLLDKENSLNVKEDDLAQSASSYRTVKNRIQVAEHKAREAQHLLEAKLQLLSKRSQELSEQEAQLSKERMLLAQDRIGIHNTKQQLSQSKCMLCRMGALNAGVGVGHNTSGAMTHMRLIDSQAPLPQGSNIVDRILDESIDESYRRMYNVPGNLAQDYWTTLALDDDSKKLAMNQNNNNPV